MHWDSCWKRRLDLVHVLIAFPLSIFFLIFLNSFLYFHIITFIIKKCTQEKEKTQDYKVLRFKRKKRREKEERYDEEVVDNERHTRKMRSQKKVQGNTLE